MTIQIILENTIDLLLNSLKNTQIIYDTPLEYLEYIEKRKQENPKFTEKEWLIISKEKEKLDKINNQILKSVDKIKTFQQAIKKTR